MSDRALAAWRARHVGLVFQFYNLLPVLSAERNVELPLLLTHLSKADRRKHVEAVLKIVNLSHRARHYPRQLSGGEQQRVGIARAIVTDPTLLLCDEPTGDLDRKASDEILSLLQALNREHGKTIIMVTHDPHASAKANRIVYLDEVVHLSWFNGIYQNEPKNFFGSFPTDPQHFLDIYPENILPADQKQAWLKTRTGAIIGRQLVDRFKWKIGDRIPLISPIWPRK